MAKSKISKGFTVILIFLTLSAINAAAEEMLAIYGLKGYAYTYSPLPSDGFHVQAGAMYSLYENDNIKDRDGFIWVAPLSLTYGDGKWWEVAAATHWEHWENTDFDVSESGFGDIFIGGKLRILGHDRGKPLDLSLMPYFLIPTGKRDKSIGDILLFNPSSADDLAYGVNLLVGRGWTDFYLSGNVGISFVDTDLEYLEKSTLFLGLALEYHISEEFNSYVEFVNNENKNKLECSPCYSKGIDEDIREIGAGVVWLKNSWGFKLHGGAGLTETSPDFRILGLINRSF